MQFQVQAGAPEKKKNVRGAKLTEKKTRDASYSFKCKQGSSEENVRGAKLTEKRTRGVPCSFKFKQGLQGRKRQGRQVDGEKKTNHWIVKLISLLASKEMSCSLTVHNWQKWKRVFLTCPCREIYRDKAVGPKSCKYIWKITIFVKMWNFG